MVNKFKNLFVIRPANERTITINEAATFKGNAIKNQIWYRGDPAELDQLYRQIKEPTNSTRFWAASAVTLDIRKIHSGLPGIIANKLSEIVSQDLNGVELGSDTQQTLWDDIAKENDFDNIFSRSITEALVAGDGAFKLSIATDISDYPIIEFISGEKVDFVLDRGRVREIIFYTEYMQEQRAYTLEETYGYGYVRYKLYNDNKEVSLSAIPQLANLTDVLFDESLIMAIPLKIFSSLKYPGRGKSIFDGKADLFDALDEIISQWLDAVRDGRVKVYIPDSLVPRNPNTGEPVRPNGFDSRFISVPDNLNETAKNEINTSQPEIRHESYMSSYINILDMCLQGLISPSTLGINVKKLDNAESQREKEKTTLYSRNEIIKALNKAIPNLVATTLKTYWTLTGSRIEEVNASISFGEYAAPDFGTVVEIISKGRQGGIISLERAIEELYGNSLTDEEKAEEVERIKAEEGLMDAEQNSSFDDLPPDSGADSE